jgi:putative oxidoreductase
MKILTHVPGGVLAFLFLFGGINFFFPMSPMPIMTGNPGKFMELFGETGYMTTVKILEIIGGVLIILPSHRAKALLILGPIAVNILFFELFIFGAPGIGVLLVALVGVQAYIDKAKFKVLL